MSMGNIMALAGCNFVAVNQFKPSTTMDYEQDYARLDIADNCWYDADSKNNPQEDEVITATKDEPHGTVTAAMLDNEDFD